jgi:hypothetical protein
MAGIPTPLMNLESVPPGKTRVLIFSPLFSKEIYFYNLSASQIFDCSYSSSMASLKAVQ